MKKFFQQLFCAHKFGKPKHIEELGNVDGRIRKVEYDLIKCKKCDKEQIFNGIAK
jgi:hypothetical protein